MHSLTGDRAVHLCLDMQMLFRNGGLWPTPWMERVLPNVVRLVERAPARTVFTRFIPPVSGEDMSGMWRVFYRKWPQATRERLDPGQLELVPELLPFAPPAHVLDKQVYSAFADSRLAAWLAQRQVTTLIVSGAETDVCVLSTVLGAVDHGYRTILVTDAICSSSDEGHDALMRMYTSRFDVQIELASTADILDRLPV